MKKHSICMICLLGLSFTLSAQIERKPVVRVTDSITAQNTRPSDTETRKERLMALDLTKEQRIKLKQIRQENEAAKQAIENNSSLSEADKKRKLQVLKREQAKRVQSILTEEQKEKFKSANQNNP